MSKKRSNQGDAAQAHLRANESRQNYAYRLIRERVLSHAYGPGSVLREVEVAESLGVSRTPVRAALEELEAHGLLQRIRGAGFTVVQMTPKMVSDIFEIRTPIEVMAVRRSGRAGDPRRWERLERLFNTLDDVADQPTDDHLRIAQEADRLFHREILTAAGNQVAIEFAERIDLRLALLRSIARRERRLASARDHLLIVQMIRQSDLEGAASLLEQHLNGSRDYLIGLMARLYPGETARPIAPLDGDLREEMDDESFESLIDRIRNEPASTPVDSGADLPRKGLPPP